ncbi:ATP-binding protein [Streptomyces reniochalinae]|uniref:ATP-binding protein n=1 Tax=Streptomyces reniochalinae TaxID=2250578 RepID=A0A367F7S9_9ACTN|nr:ATP-binding protein [Streptomyces reniochalinae]RCG25775.1 ATP-binding protein [Streptomyces reniochalinae]
MISPPSSTTEHATPAPGRHCAVEFQALPSRIGEVRGIVSAQLCHWGLDALVDTAGLGLTELLTNVLKHAAGGEAVGENPAPAGKHCTVELSFVWNRLTVSVRDHDPRLPHAARGARARREELSTHGRGLALVAAISESWGVRTQHDGSGKTVWFALPAPSRKAAARRRSGAGSEGAGESSESGPHAARAAARVERRARTSPAPAVPPPVEAETAPMG